MLWRVVRLIAGLVVGLALWMSFSDVWNAGLAAVAHPLFKLDRRIADSDLVAVGHTIVVQPTSTELPMATLPASELTYNVILVVALFASNRASFSDRNMKAFAITLLVVLLLQPIGVLISAESTYANQQGAWSEAHYGNAESWVWLHAELFYRLIGMFGVVFGAWWVTADLSVSPRPQK